MYEDIIIRMASRVDVSAIAKMQINGWISDVHKQPIEPSVRRFFLGELKKRWKNRLEKNIQIVVLELQKEMLGFIAYYPIATDSQLHAEIANIYVIPDLRRQGFGRRLCETMLQYLQEAHLISVWIVDTDQITQAFYEALGFTATKELRCDRLGNGMVIKEMRYQLQLN